LTEPIPSWLNTPPTSEVDPPVVTRKQELPFGELSWEDFEKLCLRLIRTDGTVEHCQIYGVQGQAQEGIDIFARKKLNPKYSVYQCKLQKDFEPAKIRAAVAKFLEGNWVDRTDTFVLCTMESLRLTHRAEAIEEQNTVLKQRGITLLPWDSDELNARLKGRPEIVDDFFDRQWVNAFCGQEVAEALGKRLDGENFRRLRDRLRKLYRHHFENLDPGLPGMLSEAKLNIAIGSRFIEPDVEVRQDVSSSYEGAADSQTKSDLNSVNGFAEDITHSPRNSQESRKRIRSSVSQRRPLGIWLSEGHRSVILGEQGAGKSTVLRYLAIDLLCENPSLSAVADRWGDYLPVWVPFPMWTKMIASSDQSPPSLADVMRDWLHTLGEDGIWVLVEKALEDERLLILVDGLDEWADESAARIALNQLHVFMNLRNLPAMLAGRPLGFRKIGMNESGWQRAELAGFSTAQQEVFSQVWFEQRQRAQGGEADEDPAEISRAASARAEFFIAELSRSEDLTVLARNPLLLSLLICLRFENAALPRDRFQARKAILEHLITKHPMRRREAAFIPGDVSEFTPDVLSGILGYLAYRTRHDYPEGNVSNEELKKAIRQCLEDPEGDFAIARAEARTKAEHIFELVSHTLGILVPRSVTDSGFFHRSIQEYLAGFYLSRCPMSEQETLVDSRCLDTQWREVILALFYETGRREDIARLVQSIRGKVASPVDEYGRALLLAEVAFGPFGCSESLAAELAEEAFHAIEFGYWMPHREQLLRLVLDGLRSTPVKNKIQGKIRQWFPCRKEWRDSLYQAMTTWAPTSDVVACLIRGICDESVHNQMAAAQALAELGQGNIEIGDRVAGLVKSSAEPLIRAAAMECLVAGWLDHSDMEALTQAARASLSPELRLVAIKSMVSSKIHGQQDWEELLSLTAGGSGLHHLWKEEIPTLIVKGWPRDEAIKLACLEWLERPPAWDSNPDRESIYRTLIEGYAGDSEVAQLLAPEIRKGGFGALTHDIETWTLLCEGFSDSEEVRAAVNEFLSQGKFVEDDKQWAAINGMVPNVKDSLLSLLDGWAPQHATRALLDQWGMNDEQVSKKLWSMATGSVEVASNIAHLLPRIIGDQLECKSRLLELLRDSGCNRPDFVMSGLFSLGNVVDIAEVVDIALALNLWAENLKADFIRECLFGNCASDPRVRAMADRELARRGGLYAAVARTYGGENENIRARIIELCSSLPSPLRLLIAKRLSETTSDIDFSLSILMDYDFDPAPEITTEASIGFHNLLRESGSSVEESVQGCVQRMGATGIHYEGRRQAALSGLLSLNRLGDLLDKKAVKSDEHRPWWVPSIVTHRPNTALMVQLVKYWENLRNSVGPDLWERLHVSDRFSLWEVVAPWADRNPSLSAEILADAENERRTRQNSNLIRFIARHRPGTFLLADWCLQTLFDTKEAGSHITQEQLVAARVVGEHFKGDAEILGQIMCQSAKFVFSEQRIAALCEGWSESNEFQALWEQIVEKQPRLSTPVAWSLMCCKSFPDSVFEVMIDLLSRHESHYEYWFPWYVTPILRRLQTDDMLFEKMMAYLNENTFPSIKASFPRILAAARGLSPELLSWCRSEADRQLTSDFAEIGLDLSEGRMKPVIHSLSSLIVAL
jgi:hypothetical protein